MGALSLEVIHQDDQGKEAEEEEHDVLEMWPKLHQGTQRKQRVQLVHAHFRRDIHAFNFTFSLTFAVTFITYPEEVNVYLRGSSNSAYTRGSSRRSGTTSAYRPRPRLHSISHHPFMRTRTRSGRIIASRNITIEMPRMSM